MDRERSRSRSRSRSYSPRTPRKKHKKHKHRRSSHRRSRSRSRSPSQRIHINPAFGYSVPVASTSNSSGMGYSASQLLQNNNFLESEVQKLKSQLIHEQNSTRMESQRASALSQQIQQINNQKATFEKKCSEMISSKRGMMDECAALKNNIRLLESSLNVVTLDLNDANRNLEAKGEEIKSFEYQNAAIRQQIESMNERNAVLKAKCEELVTRNRQQQEQIEGGKRFVDTAKLSVQKMETDVQCANAENQRLLNDLQAAKEKEAFWMKEKRNLEIAISQKENEVRLTSFKSAQQINEANERVSRLEERLRNETPISETELATEAIYKALECVKATYEAQLNRLEMEVEAFRVEKEGRIEELPDYLQTPRKPDPGKMAEMHRTPQVTIPKAENSSSGLIINEDIRRPMRTSSGPPMESPFRYRRLKGLIEDGAGDEDANQEVKEEDIITLSDDDETLLESRVEGESSLSMENLQKFEKELFGETSK